MDEYFISPVRSSSSSDSPVKWNNLEETNKIRRSKIKWQNRRNMISGPNRENITEKLRCKKQTELLERSFIRNTNIRQHRREFALIEPSIVEHLNHVHGSATFLRFYLPLSENEYRSFLVLRDGRTVPKALTCNCIMKIERLPLR